MKYVARIVEVPDHGIKLEPVDETTVMPWKPGTGGFLVCELNDGRPTCEVRREAE